jgi:hypothetical protein
VAQTHARMDEIQQYFFLQDRGEVGSSPEVVLGRGRRPFELATVEFSLKRWLTVRANHDKSPVALRVKMGSRLPGEASCASAKLRKLRLSVAMARMKGEGDDSLWDSRGCQWGL